MIHRYSSSKDQEVIKDIILFLAMGNYRTYTLPYRVMSSYALVNSWSSFAATARQIAAQDGVDANKCGRTTHVGLEMAKSWPKQIHILDIHRMP